MTPAEYCNSRGYDIGTRLIGDEGHGPTIIEITAIGEEKVLAKTISHAGVKYECPDEASWVFDCREWTQVPKEKDDRPEPTEGELNEAQKQVSDAYLEAMLRILYLRKHEDINFIKTAVNMPEGGMYLLQFVHVDGPKTNVMKLWERHKKLMEKSE